MDDKILFLYAQGMTTREILTPFKEMYGADVSASLMSKVTDAVMDQVIEWRSTPFDAVYLIIYLGGLVPTAFSNAVWATAPKKLFGLQV
jgi:transposase-like protein